MDENKLSPLLPEEHVPPSQPLGNDKFQQNETKEKCNSSTVAVESEKLNLNLVQEDNGRSDTKPTRWFERPPLEESKVSTGPQLPSLPQNVDEERLSTKEAVVPLEEQRGTVPEQQRESCPLSSKPSSFGESQVQGGTLSVKEGTESVDRSNFEKGTSCVPVFAVTYN